MQSEQTDTKAVSPIYETIARTAQDPIKLVLMFIGGVACCLLLFQRRSFSIYDRFERISNPWCLPKLLGKGPQTLFTEGYNKVRMWLGWKEIRKLIGNR
jgi:hypothetical protein